MIDITAKAFRPANGTTSNRSQFLFLANLLWIALAFLSQSCDYDCLYRVGDADVRITNPASDSVRTDNQGFITVEGLSYAVHLQNCPSGEVSHGEIFILVEAPPALPLFIQDEHTYPTPDGRWFLDVHLGQSRPEPGERFKLTALAVPRDKISALEALDTINSLSSLIDAGVDFAKSEEVVVIIK